MNLNRQEITELTGLLKKLKPGELPLPVFVEFARVAALPILELVPLRQGADGVEVLLLQRDASDPIWPGQLHTPGTVVRSTDAEPGLRGAMERLMNKELPGVSFVEGFEARFVTTMIHKVKRGTECSTIFYAIVNDHKGVGKWYAEDALPGALVRTQLPIIAMAIDAYKHAMILEAQHAE